MVRSFGVSLSPPESLMLLGLASLSTLVPTAPGYVGTYQLVFAHVFHMFGYQQATGIIAATAVQIFCFGTVTILGGIVLPLAQRPDDLAGAQTDLVLPLLTVPFMDFRSTHVQIRTFTLILALFAAFYVVAYLSASALPGGFEHPLGWWGWSDQGLYLKSAQAFSRFDFRSSEHTYPILYSLLAAPFVRVMPIHPFFIVDLACFLITVGGFLKIGSKIIGLWPSAILFVCVICLRWIVVADWIIPWTSTLSAAITTILLLACANERFTQGGSPVRDYLAFAVLLSLLALARPLDLIIDLVMYGYIAVRCIGAARMNKQAIFSARHFAIAAAFVAGTVIGPALMAVEQRLTEVSAAVREARGESHAVHGGKRPAMSCPTILGEFGRRHAEEFPGSPYRNMGRDEEAPTPAAAMTF